MGGIGGSWRLYLSLFFGCEDIARGKAGAWSSLIVLKGKTYDSLGREDCVAG